MDASSGKIIRATDALQTNFPVGTAITRYSGVCTINTDSLNAANYRLQDLSRGNGITTYNLNHNTLYSTATYFYDSDNFWNNVNSNNDDIATDVHWGMGKTWDYYFQNFGRNGIDNNGYALISYVHYGNGYANAYWDGMRMVFGDGSGQMGPVVSLDICAHEYTHGLVQHTAALQYLGESGAMNEAFADIFGTAVEFYAKPATANWTIGEDIGVVLRNLAVPNATGNPDTYLGSFWDVNQEVHKNSTVLSHWFYLLTTGGNGVNDLGNAYNVQGIGIHKAAMITYRLLTVYLTANSDYTDAMDYAILAAQDLFGACSPELIATTNAMYAVGLGNAFSVSSPAQADFYAPGASFCKIPAAVYFENTSVNAYHYTWNFGDGSSCNDENPVHNYTTYGLYAVRLIASGGVCGTDTLIRTEYISVNPTNSQVRTILLQATNAPAYCCNGMVVFEPDSLQTTGSHSGTMVIQPEGASGIRLELTSLHLRNGHSYLYIYDGNSANGDMLMYYTGNTVPLNPYITIPSGSACIKVFTDSLFADDHFTINWQCIQPVSRPTADFTIIESSACQTTVQFMDRSHGGVEYRKWDFGDGSFSGEQNPVHTYATNGIFDVKLKVGNAFGFDSLTKTGYADISIPEITQVQQTPACVGGSAKLEGIANGQIRWYEFLYAEDPLFTGDTFVTTPLFFDKTYYAEVYKPDLLITTGKQNTNGAGQFIVPGQDASGLVFDVSKVSVLTSVDVYAADSGNVIVSLLNINGSTLEGKSFHLNPGLNTLVTGFALPVQNSLKLTAQGSVPLWMSNHGSANLPYISSAIAMNGSIVDQELSENDYLYFYNWKISSGCISARIPVVAYVQDCLGFENQVSEKILVYPNPATDQLYISGLNPENPMMVRIFDISGREVDISEPDGQNAGGEFLLNTSGLGAGAYMIEIRNGEQYFRDKILISR